MSGNQFLSGSLMSGQSVFSDVLQQEFTDMQVDIGMNNHKINNLGNATSRNQAVNLGQLQDAVGGATQPLNIINANLPLTGNLDLKNGNYNELLVNSLRSDSSTFQAVNKYELDRLQNELANYIDNKELNSFPVNENVDMNGRKITGLGDATGPSDAVNKKVLDEAVAAIDTTIQQQDSDFQESVSQAQANSNSYTDTQMAGLQGKYARLDTLTRVELTNNVFWCGGDIFMSDQTREPGFNPPLFPQYGGIYSLRDSDLSDDRYFVKRQALPRSQILHLIGEAEDRSKTYTDENTAGILQNAKDYTDEQIALIQPEDISGKRDKVDSLQTINDFAPSQGHISLIRTFDAQDLNHSILVPSYNLFDYDPGFNEFITPYLALNVDIGKQMYAMIFALQQDDIAIDGTLTAYNNRIVALEEASGSGGLPANSTLQNIQDSNPIQGHISLIPGDNTILVPSFDYRNLTPSYDALIDNFRAVNVEQMMQLHFLYDSLETTVSGLPSQDFTQIKNSTAKSRIACSADNAIDIYSNSSTTKIGKIFAPTGQATQNLGIMADQKLQLISATGSFSLTSSAVQSAQPSINTCGIYCGMTDDQTKNQVTQLVIGSGSTCQNLTLASQHYNLGAGMVNTSTISNATGSLQQNLLISGGTPETDATIRLYSNTFNATFGAASRPIQFTKNIGYSFTPTITWGNDIPNKDYVDGVANSWLNTTLWKEFYNNVWKYLISIRVDDPPNDEIDPYYWNSTQTSALGMLAKAFQMQDNARATLLTNVTNSYQTADNAVTSAFQTADTTLQNNINTLTTNTNTALSTLNSSITIINNTNTSQQTTINSHTTQLNDHETRIETLEAGGGGGGGSTELTTMLNGMRLLKWINNVLFTYKSFQYSTGISAPIFTMNSTNLQPKILQTDFILYSGLGQLFTPSTIVSVVNSNSIKIDTTSLLSVGTNTDLRYVYNETATNFELQCKLTTSSNISIGGINNTSRFFHNVYLSTTPSDTDYLKNMSVMSHSGSSNYHKINQTIIFTIPLQNNNPWYITQDMSYSGIASAVCLLYNTECVIEFSLIPY